ncbi:(2Fe-2S)-binding protein [Bradyrhizobium prioriisuperbiae]|uniref:(2Fe-2S)-binding protein n=1 Tax=Bradyrhizobium prioriisuperbiae TaxID=2854389 RepID=UPI0028ECE584|nr:(2Fe-2S)-binding protein [Bradyrhizobium prioritasuperba]
MIVCSCNVLTDDDVRSAMSGSGDLPRTARQVYGCLGCSAQCGRCARTIQKIMKDALGACAKECCSGCPHSGAHAPIEHMKAELDQMVIALQA